MQDLESFIRNWYWDEASHQFARDAGAFLIHFMHHFQAAGLSTEAQRRHWDNVWLIGAFLCQYGYQPAFSPALFLNRSLLIDDFRFRMRDYADEVASYEVTWRELERYVRALGYGD